MAKKEEKNIKDKTSFMKSFKAELKKVSWPTPKQLFNNTVAVLAIVIITAAIVFVLDFTFESMNRYGIDKIKNAVSNSASNEENNNTNNEVENNTNNVVEENTTNNEVNQ
ncbi:MAG: preprotein translocase subunit SecE [Clostridia bacterium]|jgi:preprotein translocase subunit SecE|nr:preprotein translocase subunit SecE [Clostridia bacterium]